jgi:transposase
MKKRRTYSGEFKAEVVREFLKGRMSLQELADLYEIHPNQIKNWRTLLIKRAPLIFDDKRRR